MLKLFNSSKIRSLNARKILALFVCACLFNLSTLCMAHAFSASTSTSIDSSSTSPACHVATANHSSITHTQHDQQQPVQQLDAQHIDSSKSTQHPSQHQSQHQCALACSLNHAQYNPSYAIDKPVFARSIQSDALKDNTPRQAFLRQLDRPPRLFV